MKKTTKNKEKDRRVLPIYSINLFGKKHYIIRDREIALSIKKHVAAYGDADKEAELYWAEGNEASEDWLDLLIWACCCKDEDI